MNVTIGARCFDGERRKSLNRQILPETVQTPTESTWSAIKRKINHPGVKSLIGIAVPVVLLAHGIPDISTVFASSAHATVATLAATYTPDAVPVVAGDSMQAIIHAFDPLIKMAIALSYPIAGLMIATGCLFIMVGSKEKGMLMLQSAALGYLLCQMSPLFLNVLVQVGSSV